MEGRAESSRSEGVPRRVNWIGVWGQHLFLPGPVIPPQMRLHRRDDDPTPAHAIHQDAYEQRCHASQPRDSSNEEHGASAQEQRSAWTSPLLGPTRSSLPGLAWSARAVRTGVQKLCLRACSTAHPGRSCASVPAQLPTLTGLVKLRSLTRSLTTTSWVKHSEMDQIEDMSCPIQPSEVRFRSDSRRKGQKPHYRFGDLRVSSVGF